MAYIKIIINPYDSASFDRIINVPKRKIGETGRDKIKQFADGMNTGLIEALLNIEAVTGMNKSAVQSIKELGQVMKELHESIEKITPANFVKILIDSIGYKNYILSFDEDGLDRWSNVEELINSIKEFETDRPGTFIADFLNEVTLQTGVDSLVQEQDTDFVSLMTMHNAKGLEFPVVFISGAVDGLIPHASSCMSEREQNEERRLFYVAITRAKDKLYISYPETRLKYGEVISSLPSRFLKDIPNNLKENIYTRNNSAGIPIASVKSYKMNMNSKSFKPEEPQDFDDMDYKGQSGSISGNETEVESLSDLVVGDTIKHRQFGAGKVTYVSEKMIKVKFDKFGVQSMSGNFLSNLTVIKQC